MNYKVISLTSNDVPEIVSLSRQSLREDFPEYSPKVAEIYAANYWTKKHFQDLLKHSHNNIFGVKVENKLIAIMSLKGEFGGVLFMDILAVKKEYRKKGIGTALLQKAERWALNHAYHYLWLFTESEKNISYYKRNGYMYVGLHKGSWFGTDEHILSKQLRNEPFPEVFTNYSKYF
jgi:GNAT superfamily N-acetyltransferase